MTDLLKDVMTERAASLAPPGLDLDAIVRTGGRRIRRRRLAGATVAAVAMTCGVLYGIPSNDNSIEPASPFTERRVTYGTGDRIHYGDTVILLGGHKMTSFIQTDSGFVFADAAGGVYLADGREVTKIGTGNRYQRLTADDTGSWVGWVDYKRVPEFVVYDASTRRELLRTSDGNTAGMTTDKNQTRLVAIDDGVVYFRAADGVYSWKLAPGEVRLIKAAAEPYWLEDVADGRLAFREDLPKTDVVVSRNPAARTPSFDGSGPRLSPSGTRLSIDKDDQTMLYDTQTGRFLGKARSRDGHHDVILFQWIDDDAFVAIGGMSERGDQPVDLLTCSVSSTSCTTLVHSISPESWPAPDAFQLPVGFPL